MPQGWEWARIGFLFAHNTGKALNGAQRSGNLLPYITTSNLYWDRFELGSIRQMYFNDAEIEKCTVTKGDLLVCEGGDIGRAAIWMSDQHICIQNHIHRLRAYYPLCTRFFYYIFLLYKGIGNIGGKGIGIQGLSSGAIHNILVPVPSSQEQNRISIAIDHVLPLIEKYEKSQERLDSLNAEIPNRVKKAILQEAIQGHLVSQDATEEPAATLLQRIIDEKHRLLKEGKIKKKDIVESIIFKGEDNKYYEKVDGKVVDISEEIPFEIPESWAWIRLKELIRIISGTSYQKGDIARSGIRILRGGNIQDNELVLCPDDVWLPLSYADQEKNIRVGDVVIVGSTGSPTVIGKPALIKKEYDRTQIGAFLRIIRPIFSWSYEYLGLIFKTEYYREIIRSKAKGTNINNIKAEYIEEMLIPLPPLNEQKRISSQVERIIHTL